MPGNFFNRALLFKLGSDPLDGCSQGFGTEPGPFGLHLPFSPAGKDVKCQPVPPEDIGVEKEAPNSTCGIYFCG